MAERSSSSDTFRIGDILNNTYKIEAVLGRGGTSEVYRGRSEISGRVVAIKVLKAELSKDEAYLRLMTREEAIRDVRHEAVVRYSENYRTPEGHVFLVMDYVDGPTLDKRMAEGTLTVQDLLVIGARVTEGLVAAHARRVVHRDLSPDNIILRDGKPEEAVIIDFGIAKDDRPGAETIVGNEFAGKYAYAAPEQLHGHTDARSDLYALGATLLAAFRGRSPDLGANPVEMLAKKDRPLDTSGVPEPLRSFIDRMTAPAPEERVQTAVEALRILVPDYQPTQPGVRLFTTPPPDPDATRIARPPPPGSKAPPPRATATPGRGASAVPQPPEPAPVPQKSRGGLIAFAAVLLLALAGIGAWAGGLFDRFAAATVPVADPYVLSVTRAPGQPPVAKGFAPTGALVAALGERMTRDGGAAQVTLATGAIAEGWGAEVVAMVDALAPLPEWTLTVTGNQAAVTALAVDAGQRDAVALALDGAGQALALSADIAVGPRLLAAEAVAQVLAGAADCGPLTLTPPPQGGWPLGASVSVAGPVAQEATRQALAQGLAAVIGDRTAAVEVTVLNPTLCAVETALPGAASGGFRVVFGFGDRPDPNPQARYFVGENPVIDVVIPAEVTQGFLWVSIIDVTGSVFHLLPNLNRPDNSVATLREGRTGEVTVRVAYSIAEATGTARMAFVVDDSVKGSSKVVVLHAADQAFATLRPMSEALEDFAAAVAAVGQSPDGGPRFTVDGGILTTE